MVVTFAILYQNRYKLNIYKMKKVLLLVAFLVIGLSVIAQTKWSVDPVHSSLSFSVNHLSISQVIGRFMKFDGNYTAAKKDFSDIKISFRTEASSINTGAEKRDDDLRSDNFFNTAVYPFLKFESTSFKKVKGNNYLLTGKLTIKDVTKVVTLNVIYGGTTKDPWDNMRSGFSAKTIINRFDYNIKYDPTGLAVGKMVILNLYIEFVESKM